jgi:hypothetical protein
MLDGSGGGRARSRLGVGVKGVGVKGVGVKGVDVKGANP